MEAFFFSKPPPLISIIALPARVFNESVWPRRESWRSESDKNPSFCQGIRKCASFSGGYCASLLGCLPQVKGNSGWCGRTIQNLEFGKGEAVGEADIRRSQSILARYSALCLGVKRKDRCYVTCCGPLALI
jgi:hypothetical protein